ncbi:GNAT family N-acetyltransferase [Thalassotalea mangrovi]|uniref:GNAT family N-acetyltransferase n=1 Tax=Thalassotalea mangrovi TaxID=2572245 RepID=A0A4U1B4W1_9GAMM|nr:GNAT family N-acetyltransferase [Thalassotalea mangrovi]TKB44539.1 GNAT family N-acetyltransferase [Thalassotalea mangrovi]
MLTASFHRSIEEVPRQQWQRLFAGQSLFCQYDYLLCLERGGCIDGDSGWLSHHLVVRFDQQIIAAMPLYVKMHSYGEYMFDWSWAAAYQQRQLDYYPKLVSAIPFTPVTGARLALCADCNIAEDELLASIAKVLRQRLETLKASNLQCLFIDQETCEQLARHGFEARIDIQFQWFNQGYGDFDDFLARLTARKRKNIRKERNQLARENLEYSWIEGAMIEDNDWQFFYQCYRQTYLKRSGHQGYLTLDFFRFLSQQLPGECRLLMVRRSGKPVASALFFVHQQALFGRYWGAVEDIVGLHFEACYYQGIEYCIANRLQRFDAGVQGEHKLNRGFIATTTYGSYLLAESAFKPAIIDVIARENEHLQKLMQSGVLNSAYRQG